ncbi:hypothetical protein GEMRC1_004715 [Eukaryota sp. GEM-RC1]
MFPTLYKHSDAHEDSIFAVRFTSENQIVTGSVDETVKAWDVQKALSGDSEILVSETPEFGLGVVQLAASSQSSLVAAHSMDSAIRLFHPEQGIRDTLETGPIETWGVSMSADGQFIASGGITGVITIWSTDPEHSKKTLESRQDFVLCTAFSPDGSYLACGQRNGTVAMFDLATNSLVFEARDHTDPVRTISFSP